MTFTLQDKLCARRFVITAEVTPPVSVDRGELMAKALPLKGLVDAVNITDGAGARPHLGAVTAATWLVEQGIEPILQLTCRDRNRIALQSDLLSAGASGVRNLLMLRGDDPSTGEQPSGRKVSGRIDFFLGSADNPIDPPPNWRPAGLQAKVAAGAQFVQTQFCMDTGVVRRYMARLAESGVTERLSVLIGIVPFRSAESARWIKEKLFGSVIPDALIERMERSSDPLAEGRRICIEMVRELADVPQVSGVHIMAPGNEASVPEVIKAARESIKR